LIAFFTSQPKFVFLVDGLGAVLTASLLGFVLYNMESTFGMPKNVLFYLAGLAALFAIYSFTCFFMLKKNFVPFIRFIALVNFLYCLLSSSMIYFQYSKLTSWGVAYFIVEIIVVLLVVIFELSVAKRLNE